ncbi:benzoate 1,2-dioxygenase electron transfer component BenC [Rhodoferax mekongensis]|uniref:Benzoate 1,2-dioxygenase electron transfer component BenC n=1 Tax=Rhodoferax mekongensis TaxID=3068341 RepID=A0ABZ0AV54_9BURK|nr:benzoate 1,2-dioxygenase electron transfer component BenC [Rhodoferax sp. TBRC 17307]WNO03369.1 benzoate 1,2-dioxygenase electron transfer component BenC [Rhodoferax sp. TBRC 17307]
MTTYRIALNFEDGVTRFVDCSAQEKVLDCAFRHRINLPMDCSDGVCGTCKCRAESGTYDLGDEYIEEALTQDEAEKGLVLTCQMVPRSDCVISVPVPSTACKTGTGSFPATLADISRLGEAAYELALDVPSESTGFLPGQYVNIDVPGSGQHRSYSFSSSPGNSRMTFLIKQVNGGLMSSWLSSATEKEALTLTGPMGSFYLRSVTRPLLFLAGGTGLAPFLSMLSVLQEQPANHKIHLIYGVTRDQDLVLVERLAEFAQSMPHFTFTTCVADSQTRHERQGFVTQYMRPEYLHDGAVDVYLCGPPPMVEAVQKHFKTIALEPSNFYYEKFTPNATTAPLEKAA